MMNPREKQSDGLQAVLEQLCLSDGEERAAEEFLAGRAGEEALAGVEFRDLTDMQWTAAEKLFQELIKKKKHGEVKRLFLLLFARGQATCYQLMPHEFYGRIDELEGVDGTKRAVVYAAAIGTNLHYFNAHTLTSLLELTDQEPGTLKRAFEYEKNKFVNGKLVLLALYFWMKYKGAGGSSRKPDGEDLPLLALYEEYAAACLVGLYFRSPSNPAPRSVRVYAQEEQEARQELMAAVSGEGLEEIRQKLVGAGSGISWLLWKLTVGMSYLNYTLSDRLKNIVRLCAAANQEGVLDVMRSISAGIPMAMEEAGDVCESVFGIDSERYIRWAFEKKYWELLKRQISDNTETYLRVMGKMGLEDANRMLALIKEQKPELHKKLLAERAADGGAEEREKVIAGVLKESVNAELAGAYLRGECGADALYPQNWLDGEKHYYAGGRERDLVDSYLSNYEEPEFFRRCRVYMLVSRGGYFFRRDVTPSASCRERADAQGVQAIFADFETEGVPLIRQVFAVSLIYDTLLHEEGQKSFLEEAAKVFGDYLADENRREELIQAFAGADAVGRCFGLRVLCQDVGKN
nr:hypothetical protein [Lachnospiraceae bacterium]